MTTIELDKEHVLQVLGAVGAVLEAMAEGAKESGEYNPEIDALMATYNTIGAQYVEQNPGAVNDEE